MHNKAFSLLELTIVVLIIGMLIGVVVSGITVLETAKIRSDIAKVRKIQSAVVLAYSEKGTLPTYMEYGEQTPCRLNYIQEYSKYLTDNDYILSSATNSYFGIDRAVYAKLSPKEYIWFGSCKRATDASPLIVVTTATPYNRLLSNARYFPRVLACQIENILDDRDLKKGRGRAYLESQYTKVQLDKIIYSDFSDCTTFAKNASNGVDSEDEKQTLLYGYQLFITDY